MPVEVRAAVAAFLALGTPTNKEWARLDLKVEHERDAPIRVHQVQRRLLGVVLVDLIWIGIVH